MKSAQRPEPSMMTTGILRLMDCWTVFMVLIPPSTTISTDGTLTPATQSALMAQWHLQHNQHWWHSDTCNTISTDGTVTDTCNTISIDGTLTPATQSALMAHWHMQHNQHWWHTDTCNTISTNGTLTHATQSSLMAHWHTTQSTLTHATHILSALTAYQQPQHTTSINSIWTLWAQQSELTTYWHLQQSTLTATWHMYATCRQQVLTALTPVTDASGCKPTLFKFCTHTHTH